MEKQTGIWKKFKEDMKQNNEDFVAGQKKNINQAKARQNEIIEEGKAKRTLIKRPIKEDMNQKKAKLVADHQKNISQAKSQLKEINAEGKERRAAIVNSGMNTTKISGTRKLVALWVAIFTAPLFLFAIFLFVVAMMFFGDALFGL